MFDEFKKHTGSHYHDIERYFLKKKAFHVAVILTIVMGFTFMMVVSAGVSFFNGTIFMVMFMLLIGLNAVFYYKGKWFPEFNLVMYATAFGLYLIGTGLILELRHPSLFTVLFLFYSIIAVYQHARTVLINNLFLFLVGTLIIFGAPDIFDTGGLSPYIVYIYVFLVIFVMLLSISSFILTKQKERFYWKIAMIKERETRAIKMVFELGDNLSDQRMDYREYYDDLERFSETLSSKIGIKNVFRERINLLKDLTVSSEKSVIRQNPEYSKSDLEELKQMELKHQKKMSYVAFKSGQYHAFDFDEESQLGHIEDISKSLDYRSDSLTVKIIAFSVFITMLRINKPYLNKLSIQEIVMVLHEPDLKHLFDRDLMRFFSEHSEAFEKITSFTKEKRKRI